MGKPNVLESKRKADENHYFFSESSECLNKLKVKQELLALGLGKDEVSQSLIDQGFDHDSSRAFLFFPLIQMAWMSGNVEKEERMTILRIIKENEIDIESAAYELIELWISEESDADMVDFMAPLAEKVLEAYCQTSRNWGRLIVSWAEDVGNAFSPLLQIGQTNMTSREEKFLEELKALYLKA